MVELMSFPQTQLLLFWVFLLFLVEIINIGISFEWLAQKLTSQNNQRQHNFFRDDYIIVKISRLEILLFAIILFLIFILSQSVQL